MDVNLLPALAAVAYLVATALLVRSRGELERARGPLLAGSVAVLAHAAWHAVLFRTLGGPDLHFFAALSLASLAMAAGVIVLAWLRPLATLGLVVFPLALALLVLDAMFGVPAASAAAHSWQIRLHVALALLAHATLAIAALVALMLLVQERALRAHRITRLMSAFPPLTLVEALLFQLIGAGFVLLTLTLLTGALFVENLFAQHLVHKTALSIAAWAVFGMLMFGRWRWGWRGRRAVRLTLAGMALLLLAFVGSKFVLELVLDRAA